MSDDPRPESRAYVTVNEIEYEIAQPVKLTYPEAKEAKRVSEGMSLAQLEAGMLGGDPDAWFAMLYVSIRRTWPTLTVAELEVALGDRPLMAIVETVRRAASELATPDPPVAQPSNGDSALTPAPFSGERTPEPSTLETAGNLGS